MRRARLIGVVAVTSVAVASAAAARPDAVTMKGPIEKGGRAELRIKPGYFPGSPGVEGAPTIDYSWEFRRLAVRCGRAVKTAKHPVTGGFGINADFDYDVGESWGISGTREVGPDGTYETKVSGRRVSPKKARGWVRVFGTAVRVRGGGTDECDSGRLHWVVRR